MTDEHWVLAYEVPADHAPMPATVGIRTELDSPLVVGREGELPLGVEAPDPGVSRQALVVTATDEGWRIELGNRAGAMLHPWGLSPSPAQPSSLISWPLVAIRVHGSLTGAQHWVLLESTRYEARTRQDHDAGPRSANRTSVADPPPPLTDAELEALGLVFGQHLAWPPVVPTTTLLLKQAATRLGIGDSAVQQRLHNAHRKAERLGLPRGGRLTDPDYLHVLVSAGYIPLTPQRPGRRELPTSAASSPPDPGENGDGGPTAIAVSAGRDD